MNSLLLVTLLAAASVVSTELLKEPQVPEVNEADYGVDEDGIPVEAVPAFRRSLSLGTIGPDDRLMARITHNVAASTFVVHDQDVTFRGVDYTNITAIRVTEQGTTQNAIPTLVAGGLRQTFATINIKSVRGRAFSYIITIHSTINCSNS